MDYVFSTDPDIVVTEVEDDESELSVFYIYLDGEQLGIAYSVAEAREIASEVFAAVTGDPQEEGDFL